MNSAISQKAITGTFWMVCAFGLSKGAALVSNIVLARLLFPDDFGIFALAGTVIGIVGAFTDWGTGAAVVYKQQHDHEYTNSAFWIGMLAGVLQSVLIIAGAQLASELYGAAELRDILMVFGVVPTITSFGYIHQMLLAKELRFKAKAVVELLPGVSSAIVSIILAILGFNVWSLVLGTVVGMTFSNLMAWWLMPWRPSLHFNIAKARAVISYGKAMLGMTILMFFTDNIDYMIIGRILGAASLGLYSQSFRLATYPETTISWPVEKVAFPTFAKLRENKEALHSSFLKTIEYMALVSFPLLTLLLILSRQLILTLYGSKWEGAILPLQILCIAGMSRSVTAVSKQMLMAVGRPDINLKCNLVVLPGAVIGVIVGTQFGIVGVAVGMAAFLSIGSWALLLLTGRQIDLPASRMISALQPGLATSLVAVVGLLLFQTFVSETSSAVGLLNLAYSILIGCSLCLLSLALFNRRILGEVMAVAGSYRSRRSRGDGVWTGLPG